MKTWKTRDSLLADMMAPMSAALSRRDGTAPLAAMAEAAPPVPPQPLIAWLANLSLLYGVPFEYLVADATLLPPESLRFFYIDRNWLNRMVDGALSVAVQSSRETVFNEAFYEAVYDAVQKKVVEVRAGLPNKPADSAAPLGGTHSGLLFRSQVVSGWPGLEIQATAAGSRLGILRMDRLTTEVMLVMFNGVPDTVNIIEPGEGLHFGLIADNTPNSYHVLLRGLGFGGYPGGQQIMKDGASLKAFTGCRSGDGQPAGVVDIATLAAHIQSGMPTGSLGGDGTAGPGAVAVQLVRGAGLQAFTVDAAKDCTCIKARSHSP